MPAVRNSVSSIKSNPYLIVTPIKSLGPSKLMSGLASTQLAAFSDHQSKEQELYLVEEEADKEIARRRAAEHFIITALLNLNAQQLDSTRCHHGVRK